jgi:hypothetical protein
MAAGEVQLRDPVDVFEFGPRVRNALDREDITTVGDLLACDHHRLLDIRSFGTTMLDEVVQTLAKHGLELKKPTAPLPSPRRVLPGDERMIREQVAEELLAVDPVEWAVAGQHAGNMAARIARGES